MTRINRNSTCGNSPKNEFAQEVAIAIETRDVGSVADALAEDATWCNTIGEIHQRDAFLASLSDAPKPSSILVDQVVTHGRAGAVDGVSHFGRTEPRRFCHVIHFANANGDRVAHISSYGDSP